MNRKHFWGANALARMKEAGLIGDGIQRVVIDIPHDDYATVYVQKVLDGDVLEIVIAEVATNGRPGLKVEAKT